MVETLKIRNFLEKDYKEYGLHVLYERGIPDFYDGMTPVQRKIFHSCKKVAKGEFKPMLKIIGAVIDSGYHHGDMSCYKSCVGMAQDYATSQNNISLVLGSGNFGNRLLRRAASARYIKAKFNEIAEHIFLDDELLEYNLLEFEEPIRYYPIIPMLLVNAKDGISFGFACNILPHNPIDIIDYMLGKLKGKTDKIEILPYYKKSKVRVTRVAGNRVLLSGSYQIAGNKKVIVTELPPKFDKHEYVKVLEDLKEKGAITSYINNSKDNKIFIEVRFSDLVDNIDIEKALRLVQRETENITCIKDDNVRKFESAEEVIDEFLEWRLGIYEERYKYRVQKLEKDLDFMYAKMDFVKAILNHLDKQGRIRESELVSYIKKEEYVDRLKKMSLLSISEEEIAVLSGKISDTLKLIEKYKNVDITGEYVLDLLRLKNKLNAEFVNV